ncbi:YedD-like protein [Izhakiella capsodis]|uniref:YedD-like protein n=1 Tax=Izhakiella capsodis TaxID=1367852 RepID=A0A1I5AMI5_9GAMM|nr:lipoprotein YedD [Izhakiella capsodis]SFN63638.1 YedD-like protein [Izhakiella capsodis]
MKNWMIAGSMIMVLSGCAQLTNYASAVKTPPPAALVGNWQTFGPQSGLVSDRAMGSLIIDSQGNTLDCRQWERVIAKPGKISRIEGELVNVNQQLRVMPLQLKGGELNYDSLVMRKVSNPTPACQQAWLNDRAQAAKRK